MELPSEITHLVFPLDNNKHPIHRQHDHLRNVQTEHKPKVNPSEAAERHRAILNLESQAWEEFEVKNAWERFNTQCETLEMPRKKARSTPTPYPANLTPIPSPLRPHCTARDRIHLWHPVTSRNSIDSQGRHTTLSQQDLERIESVCLNSLQTST